MGVDSKNLIPVLLNGQTRGEVLWVPWQGLNVLGLGFADKSDPTRPLSWKTLSGCIEKPLEAINIAYLNLAKAKIEVAFQRLDGVWMAVKTAGGQKMPGAVMSGLTMISAFYRQVDMAIASKAAGDLHVAVPRTDAVLVGYNNVGLKRWAQVMYQTALPGKVSPMLVRVESDCNKGVKSFRLHELPLSLDVPMRSVVLH